MSCFPNPQERFSLLSVHEWLSIAIVTGVIGGIACLTSFCEKEGVNKIDSEALYNNDHGFDVLVKGAVDHPGIYHVQSEMKMKDLLALAEVRSDADLRRFRMDTVVKKGRVVNIPVRAMITVYLKGAVKADQKLVIPKGTKVEELLPLGEFSDNADLKALKKKRYLKSGEIITVPFLK